MDRARMALASSRRVVIGRRSVLWCAVGCRGAVGQRVEKGARIFHQGARRGKWANFSADQRGRFGTPVSQRRDRGCALRAAGAMAAARPAQAARRAARGAAKPAIRTGLRGLSAPSGVVARTACELRSSCQVAHHSQPDIPARRQRAPCCVPRRSASRSAFPAAADERHPPRALHRKTVFFSRQKSRSKTTSRNPVAIERRQSVARQISHFSISLHAT
jgi:hypothetical protein